MAVFVDYANYTTEFLAETIAHEVGHGLGLRHVNPDPVGSGEVMDYQDTPGDQETFVDVVSPIVEPPELDGVPQAHTHNPTYHLKRYVLGGSVGSSQPGTWDLGDVTVNKFDITNIQYTGTLYNVTPEIAPWGAAAGGEEEWVNSEFVLELEPGPGSGLEWYAYEGEPVRISASSVPGDTWDLFFGTGDVAAPDLIFDDLTVGALQGSIFRYLEEAGVFEIAGAFSGIVDTALELSGHTPIVILAGDYNGNGLVEQGDLDLVLLNWGSDVSTLPPMWVNHRPTEGIVDQAALDGVLLNWGNGTAFGAARVPEPGTAAIALMLAFAACSLAASQKNAARRAG